MNRGFKYLTVRFPSVTGSVRARDHPGFLLSHLQSGVILKQPTLSPPKTAGIVLHHTVFTPSQWLL